MDLAEIAGEIVRTLGHLDPLGVEVAVEPLGQSDDLIWPGTGAAQPGIR
jgi:hypothetical protein